MSNRVIFNNNATTILWSDGTKTTVKAHGEVVDHEKGLAMAVAKRVFMDADGHWKNKFNKILKEAEHDELMRVSGDIVDKLKVLYNEYYNKHFARCLNYYSEDNKKDVQESVCQHAYMYAVINKYKYIPKDTGLKSSDIEVEVRSRMEEYSKRFITQHPLK